MVNIFENGGYFYRNIDDVDKTMDEINEQTENMKQIQEALSTPIGAAADFDEVSVMFTHIQIQQTKHCCKSIHF